MLFDTHILRYYPGADKTIGRHELGSAVLAQREWLYHDLHGQFLPGPNPDSPLLLITQAGAPPLIYDTATGRQQPLVTTATAPTTGGPWQMAGSPPVVSPGGRWLALEVWSTVGKTHPVADGLAADHRGRGLDDAGACRPAHLGGVFRR